MTHDVVALVSAPPDGEALLRAIAAADPELRVGPNEPGNVLRLYDADRTLVVSMMTPVRVAVPGEASRLLGVADEPDVPYWWLELRCSIGRPDGVPLARAVAQHVVDELGGVVWSSPAPG
ncbi:hypothetical protein [Jatrophihabitans fulvus]